MMAIQRKKSRLLLLLLGSFLFLQCSNKKDASVAKSAINSTEQQQETKVENTLAVKTLIAKKSDIVQPIGLTGRVISLQKINVQAEVQGMVLPNKKAFREGVVFGKGETLIRMDNTQYLENLKAQRSQFMSALVRIMSDLENDYPNDFEAWNVYLENFQADQILLNLPEVEDTRLKYFLSARNLFNLYHTIKSAEQNLPKYRITAPFTGVVMSSSVNSGALVTPQMRLGSFHQIGTYEVEASVSTQAVNRIKVGQVVELKEVGTAKTWKATVQRIGKRIDPATQTIKIFLKVSGKDLRENLYLEGQLAGETLTDVFQLPRTIVSPQNQVYLLKDGIVKLKDVQVEAYVGNKVLVKGLEEGDVVVNEVMDQPIEGVRAKSKTK